MWLPLWYLGNNWIYSRVQRGKFSPALKRRLIKIMVSMAIIFQYGGQRQNSQVFKVIRTTNRHVNKNNSWPRFSSVPSPMVWGGGVPSVRCELPRVSSIKRSPLSCGGSVRITLILVRSSGRIDTGEIAHYSEFYVTAHLYISQIFMQLVQPFFLSKFKIH